MLNQDPNSSAVPRYASILSRVPRRYRVAPRQVVSSDEAVRDPSRDLVALIEKARQARCNGEQPAEALKTGFIEALARMIDDALDPQSGVPAFQALILKHRSAEVSDYVRLIASVKEDRRALRLRIDAVAHPGRQQQVPPGWKRDAMASLYGLVSSGLWSELSATIGRFLTQPQMANEAELERRLVQVLESSELKRLQRVDILMSEAQVRQYQALLDQQGPRSGSRDAVAQGTVSRQRGAAVEAKTQQALEALARYLNKTGHTSGVDGHRPVYRVVTSMRVPAAIPGNPDRAKTEWDAVLLQRAPCPDKECVWDARLFVEAKASLDAATTDFPQLLRGLRLLSHADENTLYAFETRQGTVQLRGGSLKRLTMEPEALKRRVLYCCDAPAEATPVTLNAANRMRVLSAPASVEFALKRVQGDDADVRMLEGVWHDLLESPRFHPVLHQVPVLRQVRDLMCHPDDLLETINGMADAPS